MNKKPDFLIIGAMKCATSTLHEQLAMQPGIFMTELKEPNFFSNDEQYKKGIQWYLSHFKDAQNTDICGESSTHYTKLPTYPQTVERMCKHLPDIKLIYVMRHPIDRLVSQYIHEWSQRIISVDINQAIYQHPELIEYSKYSMQLEPYLKAFKQEQFLIVLFERLLNNKQEELERICRFINYDKQPIWHIEGDETNVSSERMRKSTLRDLVVDIPLLKQVRQKYIPKTWRNSIKSLWQIREKPKINAKNYNYLISIFDCDLALLKYSINLELSCHNFRSIKKDTPLDSDYMLDKAYS